MASVLLLTKNAGRNCIPSGRITNPFYNFRANRKEVQKSELSCHDSCLIGSSFGDVQCVQEFNAVKHRWSAKSCWGDAC